MSFYRTPGFDAVIDLDLSRNEGRPGLLELDLEQEALGAITSRYPDVRHLTELVADRHGIGDERVLITAGGDDALLRCFLSCRGTAVATDPTFEMVRRYAEQTMTPLIEIDWWDGDFPISSVLDADADTAVIVSPNNPTGSVIGEADLGELADRFRVVVLDAAYAEFARRDLTSAGLDFDNVIVLRSLSKAYGLAGLRVGYALGHADLIAELAGFGSPYAVSGLSARLAERALQTALDRVKDFVSMVSAERDDLFEILADLDTVPLPSQANFVLATNVDPGWVVPAAASLGVGLRRFPDSPNLATSVRIGLPGDHDDFQRLVDVLRSVLAPQVVLFDMDGVLADVRLSYRAAIVATAAGFGVDVAVEEVAAAKARGNASDDWELTRRLCIDAGVDVSPDEVRHCFERIYQGSSDGPGLKTRECLAVDRDLLGRWAERLPLGVVTARPREDAEEFLRRFDIAEFFTTVVAREDAPSKPDPEPVRLALDRLGVERGWMIGDTRDDVTAARAAGVVPIAIAVPGYDVSSLRGAARILGSLNELEEVFDATNR